MEIWPNFFIVGAAKAGTTSLYAYLKMTSGVYVSPIKEPRYFNSLHFEALMPKNWMRIKDKSKYLKLFRNVKDEKAIGEASTSYLSDQDSAGLIKKTILNARIVIILRDPIQRAFSHYLMFLRNGLEKRSFHELIIETISNKKKNLKKYERCVEPSLYSKSVQKYIDTFGNENIKVLIFEEFIKNPKETVKEVLEFLGVNSGPPTSLEKAYNKYGIPRGDWAIKILGSKTIAKAVLHLPQSLKWKVKQDIILKEAKKPELSDEDKSFLEDFFRSDVEELELILKRKFPWKWVNN